ncbi:MAG: peptidylprolyl isomerase [Chitinophagaceae bacterium]|nr:MAG: peptidylprolyl isomerase [Chitinophagaceae bacterium]
MSKAKSWLLSLLIFAACNTAKRHEHGVTITTGYGDIEVELYPAKAPKTVAAFLKYVDEGLYTNGSFYRVLKNENVPTQYNTGLIQGGISNSNYVRQASLPGTPHESPKITGLTHEDGTISMARTKPGTATSEFFICIGDQKQFDSSSRGGDGQGYAAFGKVTKGMMVVRKIQNLESDEDRFINPIQIEKITRH